MWFENFCAEFQSSFYQSFIEDDRWRYILDGLWITLIVTALALIVGVVLGIVIAIIRSAYEDKNATKCGPYGAVLAFLNCLCKIYLTVIRGTPIMVQLLIMFFVIMVNSNNKVLVAVIAFGINSGAYVSEIIRGGIMSVDIGQTEAGRSLGMSYRHTMRFIIIPQAIKNVIPALGNEFITLLKETSIVTVIGLQDLTKGAMIIQGRTFQAFFPLVAVALVYLFMVMVITAILGKIERRLRRSDKR